VIDERIPSPWPAEVLEAVRKFRQGDVVDSPPFFYFRSIGHPVWQLALEEEAGDGEGEIVEVDPADGPPFGLVTTQTCDLFEEGVRPRQPWFSVAPIYDYSARLKAGQAEQIRRGEIGHLVLLTADWLPKGTWVADLRIETPIEKGWLVGRDPRPGFSSVDDCKVLAVRLGTRRNRPALSAALIEQVVSPLRSWLKDKGKPYRDEVASLRLLVPGDAATALVGKVVVVSNDGLSKEAAEVWAEFESGLIDAAALNGVTVEPFRYGTLDQLTARETEASVRLDFDFLSPTE